MIPICRFIYYDLFSSFSVIRQFYIAVTTKMIKKFPFKDKTLKNLAFLNPAAKGKMEGTCGMYNIIKIHMFYYFIITYTINKLPSINNHIFFSVAELAARFPQIISHTECDQLQEEFDDYVVTPASELPSEEKGVDNFWSLMADIKDPFTVKPRFGLLSKLAKSCCVIPTSNADPERIFSMLKKIQTDMRSELNTDTICSLMCAKQNQDINCYQFEPSESLLMSAKKAVVNYQSTLNK